MERTNTETIEITATLYDIIRGHLLSLLERRFILGGHFALTMSHVVLLFGGFKWRNYQLWICETKVRRNNSNRFCFDERTTSRSINLHHAGLMHITVHI
jgi:hypothetical protein